MVSTRNPVKYFETYIRSRKLGDRDPVLQTNLFENFMAAYKIDGAVTSGQPCLRRLGKGEGGGNLKCLLHSTSGKGYYCLCSHGNWMDHYRLWSRKGLPAVFTSEPYDNPPLPEKVLRFCQDQGLVIDRLGSDASFYNPGYSGLIVIHRPQ